MAIQDSIRIFKGKENPLSFDYYLDNKLTNTVIFSFSEYDYIELGFESPCDNILTIENSIGEIIKLKNKELVIFNDYDHSRSNEMDITFLPETYSFRIDKDNTSINYLFKVTSSALSDNVTNIRDIVSDFSKGLELDIFSKQKGKGIIDTSSSSYLPLFEKIVNNKEMILQELNYITKNPIEELVKAEVLTHRAGKPTLKQEIRKIRKNIEAFTSLKAPVFRSMPTLQNKENQVLKSTINKINVKLNRIEEYFQRTIDEEQTRMMIAEDELKLAKSKYEPNDTKLSKYFRDKTYTEYLNKNAKYQSIKDKLDIMITKRNDVNLMRRSFQFILNETWLSNINDNYTVIQTPKTMSNIHYKRIMDFYNNINTNFSNDKNAISGFRFRATYELYEIYVLILLFRILMEDGFVNIDNVSANDLIQFHQEQEFNYVKDNIRVRIIYDKTVPLCDENQNDTLVNQNSSSNRPDIIVMIYVDDNFVNSIIYEVKCRRLHSIYSEAGDTPVFTQLRDYTNFWYATSPKTKPIKGAVSNVYAIYPDDDAYTNSFCFINLLALSPMYNYKEDDGFNNLKDTLMEEIKLYY
ncbi:MAG: hypothetical protein RR646_06960 [Erysipelotrichaceae bacterium]